MNKVLLVDDDVDFRDTVKDILDGEGFQVFGCGDGQSAVETFRQVLPDAVILDLKMPALNGMEALQELKRINADIPVIIQTAYGDIPTAVEAMKHGAYDFVPKPPQFDKLVITLRRALEAQELQRELLRTKEALELSLENMLGKSSCMKKVIDQINKVAQTDMSLIIQGETGTGKTIVANMIHNLSKRNGKPFVRVDIGLIPEMLIESELFGHKKGAFTGAVGNKVGYLESANGGTIFIDELENISPLAQTKLLNFLDRKELYPVGGVKPVGMDVRIIAATNKDVRDCVRRKEIREDLFYRIGEFTITLPPLCERIDDVPFFSQKFIVDSCDGLNKPVCGISDSAMLALMQHKWPGNLRELRNTVRQASLLASSHNIEAEHIKQILVEHQQGEVKQHFASLRDEMRDLERRRICETLAKTGGNKSRAADLLKISYKNLCEKIKEYEMGT